MLACALRAIPAGALGLAALVAIQGYSANAQTYEWAWMGGASVGYQDGVYGTRGVPGVGNTPGSRVGPANWIDQTGDLWLFGGNGSSPGVGISSVHFNDLWKFNPATNEWTWMSGSDLGGAGVYGTLGVPAANNLPGSRMGSVGWTDRDGNQWLFGGIGYDSTGNYGTLNDLWKFDPQSLEWAWMGGSNTLPNNNDSCQAGVFGTRGTASAGNVPSGHYLAASWTDRDGNLWLFGGGSCDASGIQGLMNDLWRYSPSTNEWTWISGENTTYQAGLYGTLGTASPSNVPGSRQNMTAWTDLDGNLWLFGGDGMDGSRIRGYVNDLWEFNPSTNQWTWVSGSSTVGTDNCYQPGIMCARSGVYGALGQAAPGNVPGGRNGTSGAVDRNGNLWLFGGNNNPAGVVNLLNDLWLFNVQTKQWAWMSGSDTIACEGKDSHGNCVVAGEFGTYGTFQVPAAGNVPGSRNTAAGWSDSNGNLWLFGGDGFDGAGSLVYLNDVWKYSLPQVSTPAFSVAGGTYNSAQTVAISDITPNVTIYYTTDGSTPTTNSTLYSSPITVSSTEIISAIATASGYSNSAVASATYTIDLSPPSFTFTATPPSLTVKSGGTGTTTLTVTPQNGFKSAVSFACSGLPAAATCSFGPATVTPSGAPADTTLTVSVASPSSALRPGARPFLHAALLAVAAGIFGWRRRRSLQFWLQLVTLFAGLGLLPGCGSGGGTRGGGGGGGSLPTTSTITVTATSASIHQTAKIVLTVN